MIQLQGAALLSALAVVIAAASGAADRCYASDHDWKVASNVGQASLVALALGDSIVQKDRTGGEQLALSLVATEAETYGLKHAFPERRPNGRDNRSFPSGHTSISFASAGYLHQRYGWKVGLPATIAAGLVGVARVEAHEHHWYDVVAGAAIGEATAFLITRPKDGKVILVPWADGHGGGFGLYAKF
jgi:membrane-associated phospholipid phosphatase